MYNKPTHSLTISFYGPFTDKVCFVGHHEDAPVGGEVVPQVADELHGEVVRRAVRDGEHDDVGVHVNVLARELWETFKEC